MYLSKIYIPWPLARNSYQLHKALWQLFPKLPEAKRDFLFRVETIRKALGAEILMQSQKEPREGEGAASLLGKKEFSLSFTKGQRVRFRLRANPIKTIKDPSKGMVERNGKTYAKTVRVPLIYEEEQKAWLQGKLDGLALTDTLIVQPEKALYFKKPKENHSGKIKPVLFDGILTVQEGTTFVALVKNGIGPAKSFGMGMMSLAPA